MSFDLTDMNYMHHALILARRGLGHVWPNPSVGCVIVRDGVVVGRGVTQHGGRPHAEAVALEFAGEFARGATVYVTLEPCAHVGETGSCAMALIRAGVARVVVACGDPDPRVSGRGLAMLRDAGIEVLEGVMEAEAAVLNAGFMLRVEQGRPFVTLKAATTHDGQMSVKGAKTPRITGDLARRWVHLQRSCHDAILVGVETVMQDDPSLTTRLSGYEHASVRVVLDTNLRIAKGSKLVQTARDDPLWIVCEVGNDARVLEALGVVVISVDDMEIETILRALAERGITRLFVEGGAAVHRSFLRSGLYDAVLWYQAGGAVDSGVPVFGLRDIEEAFVLRQQETILLGEDLLEIYARKE